jgi:hypothetical protein
MGETTSASVLAIWVACLNNQKEAEIVSGIPEIFVLRGLVKDVEPPLVVLNVLNDFVRTSSQSVKVAFVSVLLTS